MTTEYDDDPDVTDIIVTLISIARELYGGAPKGYVVFKYIPSVKFLQFAAENKFERAILLETPMDDFKSLCEVLRNKMYSTKTGAWQSFTLFLVPGRIFDTKFNYDEHPTSISGAKVDDESVLRDFQNYPRRELPEWCVKLLENSENNESFDKFDEDK